MIGCGGMSFGVTDQSNACMPRASVLILGLDPTSRRFAIIDSWRVRIEEDVATQEFATSAITSQTEDLEE